MNVFAPRRVSTLVTTMLGSALVLSVACSSSQESTTSTSTDKTEPPTTTPSKDAGTSAKPPPAAPEDPPKTGDQACADKADAQECQICCAGGHQKGYQTYQGALLACACGTGGGDAGAGECATECKSTLCKSTPSNPDATCGACLNQALADQNAPCAAPLMNTCQTDKDCVALLKCAQACPEM